MKIFSHNFKPLLLQIEQDLSKWLLKYFSWFGRVAIVKMTILLLYHFYTLPINIPASFFKHLQSVLWKFLWAHKKPCINLCLLMKPKAAGGLGFPNFGLYFRLYYYAKHLARIIDCHCHAANKDWVSLEESFSKDPLKFSPWIPWSKCPLELSQHPIIGAT